MCKPLQTQQMSSPSLHRHALESIFVFAPLSQLATLMSVSRDWQSAVLSMRSLDTDFIYERADIKATPSLFESRLVRHLHSLGLSEPPNAHVFDPLMFLSGPRLELLSRHATHLTSFTCILASNLPTTIRFPAKLTSLQLALAFDAEITDCDNAFNAISMLACLSFLQLTLPEPLHGARFTSLAHIWSLRSLELVFIRATGPLTTNQEDDLRALSQLTSLNFHAFDEAAFWRLLRPGHALRLTSLETRYGLVESCTAALAALPTLTQLRGRVCGLTSWSCINALANLAQLVLFFKRENDAIVPDIETLRPCPSLRRLVLYGNRCPGLTVDYLSRMLANMPQLRALTLFSVLAFTDLPPLPPLLTKLEIECAADFDKVSAAISPLIHLQELGVYGTTSNWTEEQRGTFEPPCARLPALIKFTC